MDLKLADTLVGDDPAQDGLDAGIGQSIVLDDAQIAGVGALIAHQPLSGEYQHRVRHEGDQTALGVIRPAFANEDAGPCGRRPAVFTRRTPAQHQPDPNGDGEDHGEEHTDR